MKQGIIGDRHLYLNYLELLCQDEKRKSDVIDFLQKHQEISDVDDILELIKPYNISEANSFLLEKKDEVGKAVNTLLEEIQFLIQEFIDILTDESKERDPDNLKFKDYPKKSKDSHFTAIETEEEADSYVKETDPKKREILISQAKDYEYDLPKFEGVEIEEHELTKNIEEQLKIALRMCERTTVRKTMDEEKVKRLWDQMLDQFFKPYQMAKYDYLEKKIVIVAKEEDENLDNDEYLRDEIDDLEQDLKKLEEDLEKIEKIDPKDSRCADIKKFMTMKTDDIQNLKEELAENEKQRREEEEKKEKAKQIDLPKLANLWIQRVYIHLVMVVIRKMIVVIPVPTILEKFIQDLRHDEFVHFKRLVLRLHGRYKHERGLTETANNILKGDNYDLGKAFKKKKSKSLRPKNDSCPVCLEKLSDEKSQKIRLFDCGDAFHIQCVGEESQECPNCRQKNYKRVRTGGPSETEKIDKGNDKTSIEIQKVDSLLDRKSNSTMALYEHLVVDSTKTTLKFSDGLFLHPKKQQRKYFTYQVGGMWNRMQDDKKIVNKFIKDPKLLEKLQAGELIDSSLIQ
eukprot:gene3851-7011_t